jgi:hypothetical protein
LLGPFLDCEHKYAQALMGQQLKLGKVDFLWWVRRRDSWLLDGTADGVHGVRVLIYLRHNPQRTY